MTLPLRRILPESLENILGHAYAVIGGVATRLYIPERMTVDIDVLVRLSDMADIAKRLRARGAQEVGKLAFPDSRLRLAGETWRIDGIPPLDLLAAPGKWVGDAIDRAALDETGLRIAPRATLVALKLDASRGIDQGDLTRLLGSANEDELRGVRALVAELLPDDIEDLESYVTLGRLEFGGRPLPPRDTSRAESPEQT